MSEEKKDTGRGTNFRDLMNDPNFISEEEKERVEAEVKRLLAKKKKEYSVIDEPLSKDSPIQNIPLQQFLDTGLLMFVNEFLHIFGFALTYDCDAEGNPEDNSLRPARTTFRGFGEKSQTKAYSKLTEYMEDHAYELSKDLEMSKES